MSQLVASDFPKLASARFMMHLAWYVLGTLKETAPPMPTKTSLSHLTNEACSLERKSSRKLRIVWVSLTASAWTILPLTGKQTHFPGAKVNASDLQPKSAVDSRASCMFWTSHQLVYTSGIMHDCSQPFENSAIWAIHCW